MDHDIPQLAYLELGDEILDMRQTMDQLESFMVVESIEGGHHRFCEPRELLFGKILHVFRDEPVVKRPFGAIHDGIGMLAGIRWIVRIDRLLGSIVRTRQVQADQDQRDQRQ